MYFSIDVYQIKQIQWLEKTPTCYLTISVCQAFFSGVTKLKSHGSQRQFTAGMYFFKVSRIASQTSVLGAHVIRSAPFRILLL